MSLQRTLTDISQMSEATKQLLLEKDKQIEKYEKEAAELKAELKQEKSQQESKTAQQKLEYDAKVNELARENTQLKVEVAELKMKHINI